MLAQVGGTLAGVGRLVRASHERYDGRGYPDGLVGGAIPIESRIVCVCDAYNAMTTDRPYRSAMLVSAALAELRRCAGTQFDPLVVEAVESVMEGQCDPNEDFDPAPELPQTSPDPPRAAPGLPEAAAQPVEDARQLPRDAGAVVTT